MRLLFVGALITIVHPRAPRWRVLFLFVTKIALNPSVLLKSQHRILEPQPGSSEAVLHWLCPGFDLYPETFTHFEDNLLVGRFVLNCLYSVCIVWTADYSVHLSFLSFYETVERNQVVPSILCPEIILARLSSSLSTFYTFQVTSGDSITKISAKSQCNFSPLSLLQVLCPNHFKVCRVLPVALAPNESHIF